MRKRVCGILITLCMILCFSTVTANAMTIFIKLNVEGATDLKLDVEPSDTIKMVKEKIYQQKGDSYSPDKQKLIWAGKVLEDKKTLADYNMQKESTIYLIINHNYSKEWSMNDKTHWHQCTDCDKKSDEAAHVDENKDHKCDVCGKVLSECEDKNKDHKCDICGKVLSECADEDKDHKCDVCGKVLSECADKNNDHKCDICGKVLSECADEDKDHKCDVCGKVLSECADEDKDHKCDVCGKVLSECADEDKDHKCDVCGKVLSECADEDKDHKCDACGKVLSECADEDKDHKCDVCGKVLSEHTGGIATCKEPAKCEICGESYGEVDEKNHTNLKHVAAKEATVNEIGNIEYWCCADCGKYYKDAEATQEIKKADIELAKKQDNSKKENNNSTNKSSNTINASGSSTKKPSKTVATSSSSTKKSPQTVTTSSSSNKKSSQTTNTNNASNNKKAPQTADNSQLALWMALLFLSGGVVFGTVFGRKYSEKNK